jgi:hypothetical protein
MKFKMYFGKVKTALLVAVMLTAIALIVVDALLFAGVFGESVNEVVTGVSMGAGVVILAGCILTLFVSGYHFEDDHLKCVLAVFVDKIAYDDVVGIRQNVETKEVFLAVEGKDGNRTVISLNVAPDKADQMASTLAVKCKMLVEYYSPKINKEK